MGQLLRPLLGDLGNVVASRDWGEAGTGALVVQELDQAAAAAGSESTVVVVVIASVVLVVDGPVVVLVVVVVAVGAVVVVSAPDARSPAP